MIYTKIGEEKYPCKIQSFRTQMGKDAIRIIGEVPTAENGFLIVDDADNVISDRSDYIYLYREDAECKEYTAEEEQIIPTESFYMGDVPVSPIQRQISSLNNRVNAITPYTASKTAYIDDTEVVFENVKDGMVSVSMTDDNGSVPFEYEKVNGNIRVSFDKRDSLATVNISIQ